MSKQNPFVAYTKGLKEKPKKAKYRRFLVSFDEESFQLIVKLEYVTGLNRSALLRTLVREKAMNNKIVME
jgi:hypothetical protein